MSISRTDNGSKPLNTLRLSDAQSRQLMQRLDELGGRVKVDRDGRFSPRVSCEHGLKSVIQVVQPGGTAHSFLVVIRNLSESGVGFLHGGFVHPGSRCRVLLRQTDGKAVSVSGRIVRCQHASGRAHEIGVQFDDPLDLGLHIVGYGQGLVSPLWDDPEMRPLVAQFLEQLGQTVGAMCQAAKSDWHQVCRLCGQIKSAAKSFGYDPISHAAERLADAIAACDDCRQEALAELVDLAGGARRAVGMR